MQSRNQHSLSNTDENRQSSPSQPQASQSGKVGRRQSAVVGSPASITPSAAPAFFSNTGVSDFSKVKKNSKGGVLITAEEIQAAFNLLDSEKTGNVSLATLKKRLGVFFPDLTAKDYRFLMNNKKDLSIEDIEELLLDNDVSNFDPVFEAFRAFDPECSGVMDMNKLCEVFRAYGFGELTIEEIDILKRAADADGDGVIGLDDFRRISTGIKYNPESLRPKSKA